jgi:hypothetical protein
LLGDDLAIFVFGHFVPQIVVVFLDLDRPEKVKLEDVGLGVEVLPEVGSEVLDGRVLANLSTVLR